MLALSHFRQDYVLAALAAVGLWVGGRWALRRLGDRLRQYIMGMRPRGQVVAFVLQVRKLFFNNPFAIMQLLWSEERNGYVLKIWKEAGAIKSRIERSEKLSADGLSVQRMHLEDGRPIAVIVMPTPQRNREAYLMGMVLPAEETFKDDLFRARDAAEIFVLYRGGGGSTGRSTDLCGWRSTGPELTYNVGAPRDVEGFVAAVGSKLKELGR